MREGKSSNDAKCLNVKTVTNPGLLSSSVYTSHQMYCFTAVSVYIPAKQRWTSFRSPQPEACGKKFKFRGCLHGGRKILEGGTTFRLLYMQKFRPRCLPSGEGKEEKLSPFTS